MALVREVVFKKRDCEAWGLSRGIVAHFISEDLLGNAIFRRFSSIL